MTMPTPRLAAVVAIADNDVIGRNGELPWRMPNDLAWFKKITMGKPIIMGRITYESIGRPLPGRLNIVVTRQSMAAASNLVVTQSPEDAERIALGVAAREGFDEACVIGGAELYGAMLDRCARIYLTRVHGNVDGDRHLRLSPDPWSIAQIDDIVADANNQYSATIEQWDRSE